MILDELKSTWKSQDENAFLTLEKGLFMKELRAEHHRFNRTIFWRDFREVAACVVVIIFFLAAGIGEEISWPSYLATILIFGVAIGILGKSRQWKKKEKAFGNSLCDELEKRSAQLDHQIGFLGRQLIWVYLLPAGLAYWLLIWQDLLNGHGDIRELRNGFLFLLILCLIIYGINWLGARSLRKDKQKVDLQLAEWIAESREDDDPEHEI